MLQTILIFALVCFELIIKVSIFLIIVTVFDSTLKFSEINRVEFGVMLVLLLRTVARRGFVGRQRGGVVREWRRRTAAAHGHRAEHDSHREPLPPQWRDGCACAEQAGPT